MNRDRTLGRADADPTATISTHGSRALLRHALAWAVGVSGSIAAIHGLGTVTMGPADQAAGQRWILVCTGAWVALMATLPRRGAVTLVSQFGLLAVTAWATAANAGRAPGLIAAASTIAAYAAIVDWGPLQNWPRRAHRTAGLAIVPLALAQLVWVEVSSIAITGALLALSLATTEAYHRGIPAVERCHQAVLTRARKQRTRGREFATACRAQFRVPSLLGVRMPERGARRNAWIAAAVICTVIMTPLYARYVIEPADVVGSADYALHLEMAERTHVLPPELATPHPVFHYAVAALTPLLGQNGAAIAVLALASGLIAISIVWLWGLELHGRPTRPIIGAIAAVGFFLTETPAIIAQWLEVGNHADWVPTVHMHLSPTETILTPFALVQLVLISEAIRRNQRLPWRDVAAIAIVTIVSTLAKPSMTMVLLAAVPVYLLARRPFRRDAAYVVALAFFVPSALLMGWQTWFLETGAANLDKAGIAIRPMETIRSVGLDDSGPLKLSQGLVVLLCLWANARRYVKDTMVGLATLCTAAGVAVMILFNETGSRSDDGTFTKPVFMAAVVMFIVSWRFLTDELRDELDLEPDQRRNGLLLATAAVLCVGAFAGVLSYLNETGIIHLTNTTFS